MEVGSREHSDCKDFDTTVSCDPCLVGNEIKPADSYCSTCYEFLCGNCSKSHRNSRASRWHSLLDKDKMPQKKLTKNARDALCHSR